MSAGADTPWTGRGAERFGRVMAEHEHEKRGFLARHIPFGWTLLDVGCGNQLLKGYVSNPYTGLDFEADMDPDILADSTDMPCADGEYEVVVCKDHLVHVPDWRAAIAECRRVASDRLIVLERAWKYGHAVLQEEPFRFQVFGEVELAEAVGGGDTEGVKAESYVPPSNITVAEGQQAILVYDF